MTKPQTIRKINRNLFDSKLYLQGLTLSTLGQKLSPPVCRARVSQIIINANPDHRLHEIAKVLETNVATLWPKTTPEAVQNGG